MTLSLSLLSQEPYLVQHIENISQPFYKPPTMSFSLGDAELQEIYDFALDLGRRAGKILMDGVERRTGAASERDEKRDVAGEEKMNAVDIVTQTDLGRFYDYILTVPHDLIFDRYLLSWPSFLPLFLLLKDVGIF